MNFVARIYQKILRGWRISPNKHVHKLEFWRWLLYLGIPVVFLRYGNAENIHWLHRTFFTRSELHQIMSPSERSAVELEVREKRAAARDARIAENLRVLQLQENANNSD